LSSRKSRLKETAFAPKRQEESGRKSRTPLYSFFNFTSIGYSLFLGFSRSLVQAQPLPQKLYQCITD